RARGILTEHRDHLDSISDILVRRETIEKHQFEGLLAGKTEAEVFPDETPAAVKLPPSTSSPAAAPDRPRDAPRPLPRPGLAGGTTELRGSDPEQPELT
ncbi:MAG: cell division protease FtsH, partial [Solirubrobacteraceae bacterium]|nr:cell division protease FtsH [Solirubrobacteraceae bacterium]